MSAAALASSLVPPPVLASTIRASVVMTGERRLEAETYLSEGYLLRQRIERVTKLTLEHYARVWQPGRLKGIQVARENGVPFLAATQVFDVRPVPRKWLSLPRTPDADVRFVERDWMLVTRSGSVGTVIKAYRPLDGTIISDDLLRVAPLASDCGGYLYAYLKTRYARGMMRSTKYGNLIKHLEPEHLRAVPVPDIGSHTKATLNSAIAQCFALRDEAYDLMLSAEGVFGDAVGPVDVADDESHFVVGARGLLGGSRRLDAYSHNPYAAALTKRLYRTGKSVDPLSKVSLRVFMPNRFVRPVFLSRGIPLIGSEDLFVVNPEIDKLLPTSSADPELFVERGWLLVARSGQIYGINGRVVLADKWHENKIISEHAIRVVPKNIRPGYLLVALGHPDLGRPLVLREVFGTSIPEIDPDLLARVPIIRLGDLEKTIADKAERSAALQSLADEIENAGVAVVEAIVGQMIGESSEDEIDSALGRLRIVEMEAAPEGVLQGAALERKLARWQS